MLERCECVWWPLQPVLLRSLPCQFFFFCCWSPSSFRFAYFPSLPIYLLYLSRSFSIHPPTAHNSRNNNNKKEMKTKEVGWSVARSGPFAFVRWLAPHFSSQFILSSSSLSSAAFWYHCCLHQQRWRAILFYSLLSPFLTFALAPVTLRCWRSCCRRRRQSQRRGRQGWLHRYSNGA